MPPITPRKAAGVTLAELPRARARRTLSVDWGSIRSHEIELKLVGKTRREAAQPLLLGKRDFVQMRALFQEYNQSRSGFIDQCEFMAAVSKSNPELCDAPYDLSLRAAATYQSMFSAADKSGDNTLSFAEFLQAHRTGLSAKSANATIAKYGGPWDAELVEAAAKEASKLATKYRAHKYAFSRQESEEIHQVFRNWDLDGDGKISFRELCEKVPGIDRDTLGRWQHKCDVDGDGLLNKDEFAVLITEFYGDVSFGKQNARVKGSLEDMDEAKGVYHSFKIFDK